MVVEGRDAFLYRFLEVFIADCLRDIHRQIGSDGLGAIAARGAVVISSAECSSHPCAAESLDGCAF